MSMVVGFTPLGAICGALILMPTNDAFGRKWAIVIASIIFTVGAILEAVAHDFGVLLAGRIILGVALGLLSGTVPAYISENCPVRWRGGLVTLYQVMVAFGVMCGYVIAAIFDSVKGNWRWILGSSVVFSALLFLGMLTLPESTRWLMKRGRKLDSYQVWKYARGFDSVEEKREFYIMEQIVLYEEKKCEGRWVALDLITNPRCRRAVVVAVTFSLLCQQMSGVNSIVYYQATLMEQAGLSPQNAVYSSLIGGGVMFLSTAPSIYLMDKLGRRVLALSLVPGVAIGLLITGFSFLASGLGLRLGLYFWGMITYTIFWSPGLGPGPWLFASEVYPTYLRSYGMSLAALCNWTGTFVTTYPFQQMSNAMTSTGVFAGFYCGILLLGASYLLFFMPETKGLTLEQINEVFERPVSETLRENVQNLKKTSYNLLHFRFGEVWSFD
jgi:sugar porter (SP) family MFS transporter